MRIFKRTSPTRQPQRSAPESAAASGAEPQPSRREMLRDVDKRAASRLTLIMLRGPATPELLHNADEEQQFRVDLHAGWDAAARRHSDAWQRLSDEPRYVELVERSAEVRSKADQLFDRLDSEWQRCTGTAPNPYGPRLSQAAPREAEPRIFEALSIFKQLDGIQKHGIIKLPAETPNASSPACPPAPEPDPGRVDTPPAYPQRDGTGAALIEPSHDARYPVGVMIVLNNEAEKRFGPSGAPMPGHPEAETMLQKLRSASDENIADLRTARDRQAFQSRLVLRYPFMTPGSGVDPRHLSVAVLAHTAAAQDEAIAGAVQSTLAAASADRAGQRAAVGPASAVPVFDVEEPQGCPEKVKQNKYGKTGAPCRLSKGHRGHHRNVI